jgi:magnesium-transporting ATPase (P-type)
VEATGPLLAGIRTDGLVVAAEHAAADPLEDLLEELRTDIHGLSAQEAEARLRTFGANVVPRVKGPGAARRLAAQMAHFFALILWVAAALAFVGRMPQLAVAIVIVVIVNGVFSFIQEERAERAARALSALLPDTATAYREGRRVEIPAEALVPGDLLLLREGDRISADARVARSDGLRVDNSTLTGESRPVSRGPGPSAPTGDPADAEDLVFAGTFVSSGSARVVVFATGAATRLGHIAMLTQDVVRRPTPLRRDLDRAVRIIAGAALAAGVVFFGLSALLGMPRRDGFLFSVGVIVALVPEGLLPTLTLSLALSATRMAHRGALVRRLESVETLGATTVICSDKTGTMTTNQMTARTVVTPTIRAEASGFGWAPGGTLLHDQRPLGPDVVEGLRPLLQVAALCGNARLEERNDRWACIGDPTEGALLALARKGGVDAGDEERFAPRVHEYAFESARRRMSTVHRLPDGTFELLTKGSPEAVLAISSRVRVGAERRDLDAERRAAVEADIESLAGRGLRVIAMARRPLDAEPAGTIDAERDLEFLGLVGMEDPVRPEVPAAIASCRRAGIRILMVTGDHPATAASIASQVGLAEGRTVLGAELPDDDRELRDLLADPSIVVLARIAPEQKLRIAAALQALGHVVAMTGDGVNDAPALRRADIGIAMGVTGTDVAREAADLVLLDDNFVHIVEAVEEGRAAFDNIRRFLTYHLTDNVAELAPFVAWAASGGRIPLVISVLQVLALDIGTDLLPALALGAERPEAGVMERAPRPRTVRLLDRRVLARAFAFLGPVEAAVSLAMLPLGAALFFGWTPGTPLPTVSAGLGVLSAMVFASIVLMQMANAFECRSEHESLLRIGPFTNRFLLAAVAAETATLIAFLYVPSLYRLLGGRPLGLGQWAVVLASPWVLMAAEELRKLAVRRRRPQSRFG